MNKLNYQHDLWCIINCCGNYEDLPDDIVPDDYEVMGLEELTTYEIRESEIDLDSIVTSDGAPHPITDAIPPYDLNNKKYGSVVNSLIKGSIHKFKNTLHDFWPDKLPNIMFELENCHLEDFECLIQHVKPLGYHLVVIWSLSNIYDLIDKNIHRLNPDSNQNILILHRKNLNTFRNLYERKDLINNFDQVIAIDRYYREAPIISALKENDSLILPKHLFNGVTKDYRDITDLEYSDTRRH